MGLFDWFSGKPSQDKFAQIMLDATRQLALPITYQYDKKHFRLVDAAAPAGSNLYLHNAYADYCKAKKADRRAVVLKYVQVTRAVEIPDDYALAKKSLLPVIRNKADASVLDLMLKAEHAEVRPNEVAIPLAGNVVIAIGYDTEHTMMRVMEYQLVKWGISEEDVLAASIENLRDRSADQFERLGPGCWISTWGDYYDPSRLLLQDMIRRLPVKGEPVVLAPSPHRLLVTGANDEPGLALLAKLGTEMLESETKKLSGTALQLKGDTWQAFDIDGVVCPELADLQRRFLDYDYAQQKDLLDTLHEKTGDDIFVGTYLLYRKKDSLRLASNSVWTKGALTYLPVADRLTFVIPEPNEVIVVPWQAAVAIVAHQMTPLDLYPERFKVTEFPNAEQLVKLRAAALNQ
jgi:uncharacterized protein YtpQ (UPF0354 family)